MKLMKIYNDMGKIIKIRLKNFSTKNQKSILADTHYIILYYFYFKVTFLFIFFLSYIS